MVELSLLRYQLEIELDTRRVSCESSFLLHGRLVVVVAPLGARAR